MSAHVTALPAAATLAKTALSDEQCKELFRQHNLSSWWDTIVGGKNVGDEEMRAYLDFFRLRDDAGTGFKVAFDAASPSPIHPIHTILIGILPKGLRDLIRNIHDSFTVVDFSPRKDDVNGTAEGAMRAWHQNDTKMLPTLTGGMNAKHLHVGSKYQAYIEENKQLPSAQVKKGIKPEYTGYVEYTLRAWRSSQGRMVYDYYNNRFFLTPGHYAAGDFSRSAFYFVQLD